MYWLLLLLLFINLKFVVKKEDKVSFGIVLFKMEIYFKQIKGKFSLKKALQGVNLFKRLLRKTVICSLDVKTFSYVSGEVYQNYLFCFMLEGISSIRNALDYYSYGIKKERYENSIIFEGKSKLTFKCIFKIKIVNIIIVLIEWMGDLYRKSSRRNA